MDISTLALPIRKDRTANSLFGVTPSLSSVNVSYETAEGQYGHSPESASSSIPSDPSLDKESIVNEANDDTTSDSSKPRSTPPLEEREFPAKSLNVSSAEVSLHEGSPTTGAPPITDASVSPESHGFFPPVNSLSVSKASSNHHSSSDNLRVHSSPTRSSRRRARKRSSISVASAECQNFVQSLKEPKYAKPLSADEISWIFQDFYRKLRQDVLGSENELLTVEEMEDRKNLEADIESVLDRAEKAVTSGDLHSKLFSLGDHHGERLQLKLDAIRSSADLLDQLKIKLGLKPEVFSLFDLGLAESYVTNVSKEDSPKAKLSAIIKTLQYLGDSLPSSTGGADLLLPLFVYVLTESKVNDWWQNFIFIQRFRRSDALVGQADYCLTSFEAAIHVIEEFTTTDIPVEVSDTSLFLKPLKNPRAPTRYRSSSQSSRGSSNNSATATASFSQRLGETLNSYKSLLVASAAANSHHSPSPRRSTTNYGVHSLIDQRFMTADAESLTIADVRSLLKEYKRLAEYVEGRRAPFS